MVEVVLIDVDATPPAHVVFVDWDDADGLRAVEVHLPRLVSPLFTDDHRFTGGFTLLVAVFNLEGSVGKAETIENFCKSIYHLIPSAMNGPAVEDESCWASRHHCMPVRIRKERRPLPLDRQPCA